MPTLVAFSCLLPLLLSETSVSPHQFLHTRHCESCNGPDSFVSDEMLCQRWYFGVAGERRALILPFANRSPIKVIAALFCSLLNHLLLRMSGAMSGFFGGKKKPVRNPRRRGVDSTRVACSRKCRRLQRKFQRRSRWATLQRRIFFDAGPLRLRRRDD